MGGGVLSSISLSIVVFDGELVAVTLAVIVAVAVAVAVAVVVFNSSDTGCNIGECFPLLSSSFTSVIVDLASEPYPDSSEDS